MSARSKRFVWLSTKPRPLCFKCFAYNIPAVIWKQFFRPMPLTRASKPSSLLTDWSKFLLTPLRGLSSGLSGICLSSLIVFCALYRTSEATNVEHQQTGFVSDMYCNASHDSPLHHSEHANTEVDSLRTYMENNLFPRLCPHRRLNCSGLRNFGLWTKTSCVRPNNSFGQAFETFLTFCFSICRLHSMCTTQYLFLN